VVVVRLRRLFMCLIQNIIYYMKNGNTGKVSTCGNASYICGFVFLEKYINIINYVFIRYTMFVKEIIVQNPADFGIGCFFVCDVKFMFLDCFAFPTDRLQRR
jgi:hypothetical protein